MMRVFGIDLVPSIHCPSPDHIVNGVVDKALPCINTVVFGINVGQPQVLFNLPLGLFTLGVSALALTAGLLQFVQSRMLMPPAAENDPSASTQRTMMIIFPFFSILYGGFLPAGLFVYWIANLSVLDHSAIHDRRVGLDVPALRLEPVLRPKPQPKVPGHHARASGRR